MYLVFVFVIEIDGKRQVEVSFYNGSGKEEGNYSSLIIKVVIGLRAYVFLEIDVVIHIDIFGNKETRML